MEAQFRPLEETSPAARNPAALPLALLAGGVCLLGGLAYDRGLENPFELPKAAILQVSGALLLALALGLRPKALRQLGAPLLLRSGLALLLLVLGIWLARGGRADGLPALRDGLSFLCWTGVGSLVLTRPRELRIYLAAVGLLGVLVAVIGLCQRFGLDRGTWSGPRPGFRLFETLPATDGPGSVFGHVNFASEPVVLGFLAMLGLLTDGIVRSRQGPPIVLARGGLLAGLLVTASFLVIGGCRAAWLGGLAGGLLLLVRFGRAGAGPGGPRLIRRALLIGAGAIVLLVVLDPWIQVPGRGGAPPTRPSRRVADLLTWRDGTEAERIALWRSSVSMIRSHPLLGVGPGAWKTEFPRWSLRPGSLDPDQFGLARQPEAAHMEPLQLAAELGLPVAGLVGLWFFLAAAGLLRRRQDLSMAGPHATAAALVLALTAMSVGAYVFQNPVPATIAAGLLGAGLRPGRRGAAPRPAWPWAAGALSAALLLAIHHHARIEASRAALAASRELLAAAVPVQDRSAAPMPARELAASAERHLALAVTREPANHRHHYRRAQVLWRLGRLDEADRSLGACLRIHPRFLNGLLARALLILQTPEPDFGRAYDDLAEALRIQPRQPELRYALGLLLELRSRSHPARAAALRSEALAQYELAAAERRYMPFARLAAARILLEDRGDRARLLAHLAVAEENAARDPMLLAEVARIYGDGRLGVESPLFGRAGAKTLSVWERVLVLTGHQDVEALLEVRGAPLNRALAGGPPLDPDIRSGLEQIVEDRLALDPRDIPARIVRAKLMEEAGQREQARGEWGLVLQAGWHWGWRGERWKRILDEALLARERLQDAPPVTP